MQRLGFHLTEEVIPDMSELVALTSELRESANAGVILRLLERFGTDEHGPDLNGYFTSEGLAKANCFDPALIERIDEAKSRALQFFNDYDAIICPPSKCIARPHGASYSDSFDDWSYATIHNLLGWPGGAVRAGTSVSGELPVGVQVVAAPWREDIVLSLLRKIEEIFGGYQRPDL